MAKKLKAKQLTVGKLVVANEEEHTQVYTIAAVEEKSVDLVWFEGSHKCNCWAYPDVFYAPTVEQIEHSIAANGRLASFRDVEKLS